MATSPWKTAALLLPSMLLFLSEFPVHAFAILLGTGLWHTIFPHVPEDPTTAHLPKRTKFLAQLERAKDIPGADESSNEQCPTCWDELETPMCLPCGHRFCKSCILPWFSSKSGNICPVCKRKLFVAELGASDVQCMVHKLRVCVAIICVLTSLLKVLPCLYVHNGYRIGVLPVAWCVYGRIWVYECVWKFVLDCGLAMAVVSAWQSFRAYGQDWHRGQFGGWFNILATMGLVLHCNTQLQTLSKLVNVAARAAMMSS